MKYFLIILLFISQTAYSTTYYVSNAGNNANAGTSAGASWATLSKVNAFSFAANDSILFKRGDIWLGSVVVPRSNLNFDAYGSGARPIITGLVALAGWSNVSGNLWKTTVVCPNDLRYVTIDGVPTEWARTPNKGAGLASYYYASSYVNTGTRSITLPSLPTSPDRDGQRFYVEEFAWKKIIGKVISHSGTTITFAIGATNIFGSNPSTKGLSGTGNAVCFVGNVDDVDSENEWAYDSTNNAFFLYSTTNPSGKVVKVSTIDKLFDLAAFGNISIKNIEMQGANGAAVYSKNSGSTGNLTFINDYFNGSGNKGLAISNCDDVTVEDDAAINCYDNTFMLPKSVGNDNASVKRNSIVNNGPHETMAYCGEDQDGAAIVISMNNVEIFDNYIYKSHYHGINAGSGSNRSNVEITRNLIRRSSMFTGDDGGIYFIGVADASSFTAPTNGYVHDNWIDSANSWPYGRSSILSGSAKGIYNDARTYNILYYNNYITNCDIGISSNNPNGITIRGGLIVADAAINIGKYSFGTLANYNLKSVVISNRINTARTYWYFTNAAISGTVADEFTSKINIDSCIGNGVNLAYQTSTPSTKTYYFIDWKTTTGASTNDVIVPFLPFSETGRKIVSNWTLATVVSPLTGIWKDYLGNTYNGAISLPPKTVKLIYYSEAIVPTLPGAGVTVPWRAAN